MKLPDVIIERLIQRADDESDAKMETTREMGIIWDEVKFAIAAELAEENNWDEPDMAATRTWYIESVCASVAKIAHSSGYNRMRVWDQVLARGFDKKYDPQQEFFSFSDYLFLLRNLKKGDDGLIPEEKFKERVDWYFKETDEFGKPPGTRDIVHHAKHNGDYKEWEQSWKSVIRIAKKIVKMEDVPNKLQVVIKYVLSFADVDFTGGKQKKKELVNTAGTPRKYEVPTIIYKDKSGYTNAQRSER